MTELRYGIGFTAAQFLELATNVWPRQHDIRRVEQALERTVNFGAWSAGRLVGSIRVLTDGYFFATVPEILVDPAYQRRGIGRALMDGALIHAPRGLLFFGAQPQSVGFFQALGCAQSLTGFTYGTARPLG